jgi:hypothetical protein
MRTAAHLSARDRIEGTEKRGSLCQSFESSDSGADSSKGVGRSDAAALDA